MKELTRQQRMEVCAKVKNGELLSEILTKEYLDYEFALVIKTESCKCGGSESHPFRSGPVIGPSREEICNAYFTRKEAEEKTPRTPAQFLECGYYYVVDRSFRELGSGYLLSITPTDTEIRIILPKLQENLWPNYIENPKTKGSGIVCCIPQTGRCPMKCKDCFFQSGRSYLEPLNDNLPNMPNPDWVEKHGYIVRVNDGNDSNNQRELVIESTKLYKRKFYDTSIPKDLENFDAPVVLTVNPAQMTDTKAHLLDPIPKNLMFVRVRVNTWNLNLVDEVVEYYSAREVPIILTFMAYFEAPIPAEHEKNYIFRKRTLNPYHAITTQAWKKIMARYLYNKWVYSCGKIEGERGTTACRHCGNCLREYFATMEKMRQ
jgi:hypothetical protein